MVRLSLFHYLITVCVADIKPFNMKKLSLFIAGIILFAATGMAQLGTKQLSIAADASAPTGAWSDFSKAGYGTTVKLLYGISRTGQVTFTSGYTTLYATDLFKVMVDASKVRQYIVPVLAGYRHSFNKFYVEPQVGYGIYGVNIKEGLLEGRETSGAFTWAAGAGFVFNNIELGARYQSAHRNGETNALVGVRLGYNFSL